MKPKLFVGNLSYETKDEELKTLFAPYGEIASAVVIFDKKSGKSKGYGFVQMVESKDAARALEISGQTFMGRDIIVTEAESPMDGEPRDRNNNRNSKRGNNYNRNSRNGNRNRNQNKKKTFWEKLFGIFFPKKEEEKPKRNYSNNRNKNRRPNNNNRRNNNNRNSNSRGARRSYSS